MKTFKEAAEIMVFTITDLNDPKVKLQADKMERYIELHKEIWDSDEVHAIILGVISNFHGAETCMKSCFMAGLTIGIEMEKSETL